MHRLERHLHLRKNESREQSKQSGNLTKYANPLRQAVAVSGGVASSSIPTPSSSFSTPLLDHIVVTI
jgi:hypothetical protein